MLTTAARRAADLHRRRQIPQACEAFARVLATEPPTGEVHRLFGIALRDAGLFDTAIGQFKAAVVLDRDVASMENLAESMLRAGQLDEATQCFEALLQRDPDSLAGWRGLGGIAARRDDDHGATALLNEALKRAPDDVTTLVLFGLVGLRQGFATAAREALLKAARHVPQEPEALCNVADALCTADMEEQGLVLYDDALTLQPDLLRALGNRGGALLALGRAREALPSLQAAAAIQPDAFPVVQLLVTAWRTLGDLDRAEEMSRKAMALQPDNVAARANRATLMLDRYAFEDALAAIRDVSANHPDDPELERFESLILLTLGRFEEGWRKWESRLRIGELGKRSEAVAPFWTGTEDLEGKRILMAAEEGFGDTIQFVRYASLLAARGAIVGVRAPLALFRLLTGAACVSEVHVDGARPDNFDYEVSLLSLPYLFGTDAGNIPAQIPYITVPANETTRWRARLDAAPGVRVGLVWAGNPKHRNNHNRSLAWDQLRPITELPGLSLFSLQVGPASEVLARDGNGVVDLAPDLKDYGETAGAVAGLDLVITVDTSVAHLAGALGVPVWVLLPRVPDWRWMLERTDSPWYPTMRLFRQPEVNDWGSVVGDLCQELAGLTRKEDVVF